MRNLEFLLFIVLAFAVGAFGRQIVEWGWGKLCAKLDEDMNKQIKHMMSEGNL